jgi:glycosyltransferase involved in cell wall biosynthesis
MRIAVCHNQSTGGARRALHGFCTELKARHSLDVFTFDTADDEWLHDADIADRVDRRQLVRRSPIRFGVYANDFLRMLDQRDLDAAYASMAERIDRGGYDVALVDVCRYMLVPSVLICLKTPSVFYAHNGPASMEEGAWDPPRTAWERARRVWHLPVTRLQDASLAARQRSAARSASVVATNSRHTANRLSAAYQVEAVVCPPGIDLPPPTETEHAPFVLSVGEIEPRKGFMFVMDALACLPAAIRPELCVLANRANPVELARLHEHARDVHVELDVLVAPTERSLAWHYAHATLFAYAARNEALGLAPLEAMAHGTPVVAVGEGGVAETVISGATGYLTKRDVRQFAERVRVLLEDEVGRARMGRRARVHVEEHWALAPRARALEGLLASVARVQREVVR